MRLRLTCVALVSLAAACSRQAPSEPLVVDAGDYQKQHQAWLAEQQSNLSRVLPITGIWQLPEGDTAFGADASLPIVLPSAHFPQKAGVFRRSGGTVTVVPAAGGGLRLDDGATIDGPTETDALSSGPIRLEIGDAGDDRKWVTAVDTAHPAATNPPAVPSYPLDPRWRVPAVFDAYEKPRPVRVPDVQGGVMTYTAVGELVFRLEGEERRLVAFGDDGYPDWFVMFRDPTNQTTTYSGYRIVLPKVVKDGETTILDFNFATNPPCAYSRFTTCPLPPPQNRLPVAVEAGLLRLPSATGFVPQS